MIRRCCRTVTSTFSDSSMLRYLYVNGCNSTFVLSSICCSTFVNVSMQFDVCFGIYASVPTLFTLFVHASCPSIQRLSTPPRSSICPSKVIQRLLTSPRSSIFKLLNVRQRPTFVDVLHVHLHQRLHSSM